MMPIVCCPTQRCFFHLHFRQWLSKLACSITCYNKPRNMHISCVQEAMQQAAVHIADGHVMSCSSVIRTNSSIHDWNDVTSLLAKALLKVFQLASGKYCAVICLSNEVESNVTYHVPLLNVSTFLKQQLDTCQMACKETARINLCTSW